jgi:hypothetical protein
MKVRHDPSEWPAPTPGRCNFRKRDRTRCQRYPLKKGKDLKHCKVHQRAQGEAHGSWKGGRSKHFRKHLPENLLATYDAVMNDPEISSVRELIAMTSARYVQLWAKVPTRESAEAWDALGEVLAALERLVPEMHEKSRVEYVAWLDAFSANYKTARHERAVYAEIMDVTERMRKLGETEAKREATLQANLTANQAIALMNGIFRIHVELIRDLGLRKQLGEAMLNLLGAPEVSKGDSTMRQIAEVSSAEAPTARE